MDVLEHKISGQAPVAAILTAIVPLLGGGCSGVSVPRRTPAGGCDDGAWRPVMSASDEDGAADAISSAGEHGEIRGSHRVFVTIEDLWQPSASGARSGI